MLNQATESHASATKAFTYSPFLSIASIVSNTLISPQIYLGRLQLLMKSSSTYEVPLPPGFQGQDCGRCAG